MADLWHVIEATSDAVEHGYFSALARALAEVASARLVLVLAARPGAARVLAAFAGNEEAPAVESVELALEGTALEPLLDGASSLQAPAPSRLGRFVLEDGARLAAASSLAGSGECVIVCAVAPEDGLERVGLRALTSFARRAATELAAAERARVRRDLEHRAIEQRIASVSALASGLAHEINNPLTYILGNLDIALSSLEASAADADLVEMLREARQGALRISDIIRGMRVFARVEPDVSSTVDVDRGVAGVLTVAKNEIRHRARLIRQLGAPPSVTASEAMLVEVVLDLMVNAVKAIPEGHVERDEISVTTGVDPAGRVFIEIRDTGEEMAPETKRSIVGPCSETDAAGGVPLVQSAVTSCGGDVSVSSVRGAGSTVRLSLPAAQVPVPAMTSDVPPAGRRRRVLIVDDEAPVVRLLRRLLVEDHDVVVAPSGRDALETLRRDDDFDAILCDVMMPDLTGADVHQEIARESPSLAARFVFVTGGAFGERAKAHVASTKQPIVTKPFRRADVLAAVVAVSRVGARPRSCGRGDRAG